MSCSEILTASSKPSRRCATVTGGRVPLRECRWSGMRRKSANASGRPLWVVGEDLPSGRLHQCLVVSIVPNPRSNVSGSCHVEHAMPDSTRMSTKMVGSARRFATRHWHKNSKKGITKDNQDGHSRSICGEGLARACRFVLRGRVPIWVIHTSLSRGGHSRSTTKHTCRVPVVDSKATHLTHAIAALLTPQRYMYRGVHDAPRFSLRQASREPLLVSTW